MAPVVPRMLVVLLAVVLAVGCSKSDRPPLGTVSGAVTLDGRPLADALVLFTPDGPGRTSQGITDADGLYSLVYLRDIVGANVGRHAVRITTARDDNGGRELLPPRYHAKSELQVEVLPGSNRFDFPLTSK